MKQIFLLCGLMILLAACSDVLPTPRPPPPTNEVVTTPIFLPTFTPAPLNDPDLIQIKKYLKEGLENKDSAPLEKTISYNKWVASIYREGGTPPIDPRRGLNLSLQFAKENQLVVDIDRPTYEPRWSVPVGEATVLVLVTPPEGEPYHAHLYIQHEPSAWRYTGILTRIPYYDAPTIAQVHADPAKYDGKEYMYVGKYQPISTAPPELGAPPENAWFWLDTFSGPIWVSKTVAPYVGPLPDNADSRAGELVRVFGTVHVKDGKPYIDSDSSDFIDADAWMHVQGTVEKVDSATRVVTIKPNGTGPSTLKLTETTFVSLPDATRGSFEDIKVGQKVDATGVPQKDGDLLVEELFIAR